MLSSREISRAHRPTRKRLVKKTAVLHVKELQIVINLPKVVVNDKEWLAISGLLYCKVDEEKCTKDLDAFDHLKNTTPKEMEQLLEPIVHSAVESAAIRARTANEMDDNEAKAMACAAERRTCQLLAEKGFLVWGFELGITSNKHDPMEKKLEAGENFSNGGVGVGGVGGGGGGAPYAQELDKLKKELEAVELREKHKLFELKRRYHSELDSQSDRFLEAYRRKRGEILEKLRRAPFGTGVEEEENEEEGNAIGGQRHVSPEQEAFARRFEIAESARSRDERNQLLARAELDAKMRVQRAETEALRLRSEVSKKAGPDGVVVMALESLPRIATTIVSHLVNPPGTAFTPADGQHEQRQQLMERQRPLPGNRPADVNQSSKPLDDDDDDCDETDKLKNLVFLPSC